MTDPPVLCVMLSNGRPEMAKRAIASFRAQTYENKRLLIWDTTPCCGSEWAAVQDARVSVPDVVRHGAPIGELRNEANHYALDHYGPSWSRARIIAHWDSDDWSGPQRLTEQVAFLEASGAGCVGYNEMLFWDTTVGQFCGAWLHKSPNPKNKLGTSLLYWRETWERVPFRDVNTGEDTMWALDLASKKIKSAECSSLKASEPRMIASIHGDNTCSKIKPGTREWSRAAQFDKYCAETMKLCA